MHPVCVLVLLSHEGMFCFREGGAPLGERKAAGGVTTLSDLLLVLYPPCVLVFLSSCCACFVGGCCFACGRRRPEE